MRPPPTIPTFTVRIIPNLAGQGYSPHPASRKIDGPEKEKPLPTGRSEGLGRRFAFAGRCEPTGVGRQVLDFVRGKSHKNFSLSPFQFAKMGREKWVKCPRTCDTQKNFPRIGNFPARIFPGL